jgi:3-methyladenine DNA glycosylase AlkD
MTLKEALAKLESFGSEKMRQHNERHGYVGKQFGVMMGDIRKVAKTIKKDNALARSLWKTDNLDARLLSVLIIDPNDLQGEELENMVGSASYAQLADWVNSYIVKEYRDKENLRKKWIDSKNGWLARAGWSLTAGRVAREPNGIDIPALLDRIEKEMAGAKSEVQWTMNTTLAQIGIHHAAYRNRALTIGERLGIYRDYPVSKGCTSPFAPIWINEMVSRQK